MTDVPYLIAGYGISFALCGIYAGSVMRRAKRLTAKVPAERARWMTGNDSDVIGDS